MNCTRYRQAGGAALVALALIGSVSCASSTVQQGRSPAYLVIDRLQASPGSTTNFSDTLQSDVQTGGSIFEDNGQVTLHVALKDPGPAASPTVPSQYNLITLERYHVNFARSDGRNTQGVDVPYAFDGAATGTVTEKGIGLGFVIVRAQAKAEAPLRALRNIGGAAIISTIAEVTFYGHDQAGNAVSVAGTISVNFADWADQQQ